MSTPIPDDLMDAWQYAQAARETLMAIRPQYPITDEHARAEANDERAQHRFQMLLAKYQQQERAQDFWKAQR